MLGEPQRRKSNQDDMARVPTVGVKRQREGGTMREHVLFTRLVHERSE